MLPILYRGTLSMNFTGHHQHFNFTHILLCVTMSSGTGSKQKMQYEHRTNNVWQTNDLLAEIKLFVNRWTKLNQLNTRSCNPVNYSITFFSCWVYLSALKIQVTNDLINRQMGMIWIPSWLQLDFYNFGIERVWEGRANSHRLQRPPPLYHPILKL